MLTTETIDRFLEMMPALTRGTRRRVLRTVSGLTGGLVWAVTPVVAHDDPVSAAGPTTSVGVVVLLAVGVSLLGGVGIARWRSFHGVRLPPRYLGVVLALLGGAAVVTGLTESLVLASGGVVAGVGVAAWATHSRGHAPAEGCADATLGAVLLHRVVEGVVVATAAATGTVFGIVGALVFAAHAAAETCAVSGLYATHDARRALVATALVQVAFVVGALVGVAALSALPAIVRVGVVGFAGGVLLTIGVTTLRQPSGALGHATPPEGGASQTTPPATEHRRH